MSTNDPSAKDAAPAGQAEMPAAVDATLSLMNPSDPIDPIDPMNPTNPMDPMDPMEPMEPSNPMNAALAASPAAEAAQASPDASAATPVSPPITGLKRLPKPEELLAGVRGEMDALSEAVLDAANLASRSAQAAVGVGGELKSATSQLRQVSERAQKQNRILIAVASTVMLLALALFVLMGVRMVSRINQLDTMLLAVGKRVVDLNAGLESLDALNRSMAELAQKQDVMTKSSDGLQERIDASIKQAEALVQQVPAATAKQVAASGDNLVKQVQGINSRLQAQANAVQSLGTEVKALKGSVGNVDKLNRDVQALVTLQRERYLEALQKNNAAAVKERNVQFPRMGTVPARPAGADIVVPAPEAKP